jgi:hypothetical protein
MVILVSRQHLTCISESKTILGKAVERLWASSNPIGEFV